MTGMEEAPFIECTIRRHGVIATANVEILDGWVPDHDELAEVVGMAAVRIARQACATREAARDPQPF